jgi:hypothetical protein
MTFRSLLFAFCIPLVASSQDFSISGTTSDLDGKIIELIRFEDPISKREIILSRDSVDASGEFNLKTRIGQAHQVWIRVNRFKAPLIAQPDANYKIEIPASEKTSLLNQWRPGELEYLFVGPKEEDINAKIIDFDNAYFSFFQENARLLGTRHIKPKVLEFQNAYTENDGTFYKDYIHYSIAEMKLSSDFPKKEIYDSYLASSDLPMQNPAFFSFFTSFYTGYFEGLDIQQKQSSKKGSEKRISTLVELDSALFKSNDFLVRDEVRHWVLLIKIKEALYSNTSSSDQLLNLLNELEKSSDTERVKRACRAVESEFYLYSKPNLQELFPGIADQIGNEKPSLLVVSYPQSLERLREKGVIENLLNEYGDFFQVVEVFLGNDFEPDASWVQTRARSEIELMNGLAIYKLPWYGWVDSEFALTKDIERPSEGLEKMLYAIRAEEVEKNKIKVGQ